jgi:hypothetical protein
LALPRLRVAALGGDLRGVVRVVDLSNFTVPANVSATGPSLPRCPCRSFVDDLGRSAPGMHGAMRSISSSTTPAPARTFE